MWVLESKVGDRWITAAKYDTESKAELARWEAEERYEGSSAHLRGENKLFRIRVEIAGITYPRPNSIWK